MLLLVSQHFMILRVSNNLTVEGTTTTLDTNLINVDRVEVGADSNTTVAVSIAQTGTADIINLFDGTTEVLTVTDGGKVGIGEETPDSKLDILHSSSTNSATENLIHLRTDPGAGYVSRGLFIKIGRDANYDNSAARYDIVGSDGNSGFHAFEVQGNEHLRITKDGRVGIGSTSPSNTLVVSEATDNNASIQLFRASTGW